MNAVLQNRWTRVGAVLLVQAALVAAGVAPQLLARATGEEILLSVEPVDPIDPFRGAYVTLDYPGLRHDESSGAEGGIGAMEDGESGDVFVTVEPRGAVWVATDWTRERPSDGLYLACDDDSWQIRCGIESYFLPQDKAAAMQDAVDEGAVVARVKVDNRGHAALMALEPAD